MKKLFAALLFAPLSFGWAAEMPGDQQPVEHTVMPKDTLWDLAGRYYHDHYKWRYIAQANPAPKVRDPHWIYPNQILRIPPLEGTTPAPAEAAPAAEESAPQSQTEEPAPQNPAEKVASSAAPAPAAATAPQPVEKPRAARGPERQGTVGGEGVPEDFPPGPEYQSIANTSYPFSGRFKAKSGWQPSGVVVENVRDGEHETMEGDTVEVRLDSKVRAKAGEEFSVFRRAAALDTEPDQEALYLVRVGRIEIQGLADQNGVYKATILEESDPVQPADWIQRE